MADLLRRFENVLASASEAALRNDVTLGGALVLERAGPIVVSYAPFEHVQAGARVVIVGITPGEAQARNALLSARSDLSRGVPTAELLRRAKVHASFSGEPMRSNLIAMLDKVGLATHLGIETTQKLWAADSHLIHYTSALRYPVFLNGQNYSGQPSMIRTPFLSRFMRECLGEEARALNEAVWIPLGDKPATALKWLVDEGLLAGKQVLDGLPHPSGANSERVAYFLGGKRREDLSTKTRADVIDHARERLTAKVSAL
jgi:hypothetical protein